MRQGTIDLSILIIIFIGLQSWWIIPIIKRNINIKKNGKDKWEEIKKLERIYKK